MSAEDTVWIVVFAQGSYSDYTEWPYGWYGSEELANAVVQEFEQLREAAIASLGDVGEAGWSDVRYQLQPTTPAVRAYFRAQPDEAARAEDPEFYPYQVLDGPRMRVYAVPRGQLDLHGLA